MHEVFVLVVHIFDDAIIPLSTDRQVIEHGEVTHHLAQADTAGVGGAHAHAELVGEQVFEHDLLRPGDARGVDLHDLEAARLQILLVHDAVLHLLAGGGRDRVDGALSTAPMAMCSTPSSGPSQRS